MTKYLHFPPSPRIFTFTPLSEKVKSETFRLQLSRALAPVVYMVDKRTEFLIRIAILSPVEQLDAIIAYLHNLNSEFLAKQNELFMPSYEGFYETFNITCN